MTWTVDLDYLYDNRSDPHVRSVLEDLERLRYGRSTVSRLGYALSDADADADAAAAADAAADADADADAAADAAAAADADAGAGAGADAAFLASNPYFEDLDMTPGLKILQIQVTTWRAITFVGWLHRIAGDEYHLVDARIITRKPGVRASWNGVAELAENGPTNKYNLAPKMRQPEELHRLGNIRRCKPADEAAWAAHCPRPEGWTE